MTRRFSPLAASGLAWIAIGSAAAAADTIPTPSVTPNQVVSSLEATFGVHPGRRRNHIKGTCAAGEFVGTPAAAALSRSRIFSGAVIPVVARFSVAGGNPNVADATPNARGMALELRIPGGSLQHMTMLNTPVFGAANPTTFNDMIIASRPDPKTGKPDPKKLQAFFASHPDAQAQSSFLKAHLPPVSYANAAYFGIHTFKFVDVQGVPHAVKWRFMPRDGEKRLTEDGRATAPRDFLEQRLIERSAKGPILWDMVVSVGEPGDPEDNPTIAWPESRRHYKAGTLRITQAMPEAGAECEKINFDPLVMSDGILPTNDPVLLFRSPAYAISFSKRLSGQP
jgi:catalase